MFGSGMDVLLFHGSGDFWDKSPSCFLKILKLKFKILNNFKIFKKARGQFIPNHLPKHIITSTNNTD